MTGANHLIVGNAIVDDIVYADGSKLERLLGGAGIYALAGAALWSDRAVLVTGVGRDFGDYYGAWMKRNELSGHGLRVEDEPMPHSHIVYDENGDRVETPRYGSEHFSRMRPTADDLAAAADAARGIYLFRHTDEPFWREVAALRRKHRFHLLWEISLDAATAENRPTIERTLESVDSFSLNLEEARLIFETQREEDLLRTLAGLPVGAVFLRAGKRGSYVIVGGEATFMPRIEVEAVDVTGAGNAYCGAALVGLAEGASPHRAVAMGTIAAALAVRQHGPFAPRDQAVRALAAAWLKQLTEEIKETT